MTNQELKKLRRQDLLELLLAQSKEVEQLKARLSQAEEALCKRQIDLSQAGSIAEAALQINHVFSAAEAAAQWLENIQYLSDHQEALCAKKAAEQQEALDRRVAETERMCQAMEAEARKKCDEMVARAQQETQPQWDTLQELTQSLNEPHETLEEWNPFLQGIDGGWME